MNEPYKLLFDPKDSGRKMNVIFFFSHGASSMKYVLEHADYGKDLQIVGAFTDAACMDGKHYDESKRYDESCGACATPCEKGIEICKNHNVPIIHISKSKENYCKDKNLNPDNEEWRFTYNEEICNIIKDFNADIIGLSGYMQYVKEPLIGAYKNKIFNVHPADLCILASERFYQPLITANPLPYNGNVKHFDASDDLPDIVKKYAERNKLVRRFIGNRAVRDAILAGETSTRSTVHVVTDVAEAGEDAGPIVVQSKPFKIKRPDKIPFKEYREELQNEMKYAGDGPAFWKTLELTAQRRLAIGDDNITIYLCDKDAGIWNALPYCGVRLD
jgi:folate-dependent phosphoribosylglycinamide formyltransferase PurN